MPVVDLRRLSATVLPPARGASLAGWTTLMLAAAESHKLVERKLGPGDRQDAIFQGYMRRWTAGILRVCGVRVHVVGDLPPPATGPRMVVSNHRCALDIPMVLTHFGGSVLSRADLEHWPLIGLAAQKAQTIFVDRENRSSGAKAIRSIRAHLQRGRTITVFPEGTVFLGDELRPFMPGAFAACRGLEVEYVPIGLAYPHDCEWGEDDFIAHARSVGGHPHIDVVLAVGAPRRVDGRAAKVAQTLHGEVQDLVHGARRALDQIATGA